jgi:hypothetical protein
MSNKTKAQRLARALQRVTFDELGIKPKLQTCHNIVREAREGGQRADGEGSIELRAARLFEGHRERLKASAEDREERRPA